MKWTLAAVAAAIVLVVGGTWLYINVIRDDPPAPLSFEERDAQASDSTAVATFPTSTFRLTAPIELPGEPADLEEVTATATGELTLRGQTRPVTFDVVARRNGENIEVNGSIPIVFEEWGIPNPSRPGISTEDNGLLEFLLVFSR